MGWVRFWACCVGLVAALATVGCGSSGSGTTGAGTTSATGAGGGGKEAIHEPVQSRGIKGENPATEAATRARLSAGDCAALAGLAEKRLGKSLSHRSDPSPPLSHCDLSGRGVSINVFLDAGFAAHQRYNNRIAETVQFNYEDQAAVPHPVPHVGEKAAYNADANWIPALRSLLAVRGNRWLTVTISAAGLSNRGLRDEAAVLALAGFKLSAVG
jgi:hypothetical protein